MRLFLASFLGRENAQSYQRLVHDVISAVPGVIRPVPRGTQHLTMVFIGDVADNHVEDCLETLKRVETLDAVPFLLAQPRVLFARRSPRLVCVDLASASERVHSMQKLLHEELSRRLPSRIAPPRAPHVTLARFRRNASRQAAHAVIEALSEGDFGSVPRKEELRKVELVKSTLTPEGPVYESIAVSECRG